MSGRPGHGALDVTDVAAELLRELQEDDVETWWLVAAVPRRLAGGSDAADDAVTAVGDR